MRERETDGGREMGGGDMGNSSDVCRGVVETRSTERLRRPFPLASRSSIPILSSLFSGVGRKEEDGEGNNGDRGVGVW